MPRPLAAASSSVVAGLLALALVTGAGAQDGRRPDLAVHSVCRMRSHGGSATVIWTGPNKSYLLSCGHCFWGEARGKPISLDVPDPRPGPPRPAARRLVAVDYERDLSLIELDAGPLPYVAPVAPPGHRPGRLLSCGYDEMRLPGVCRPAHVSCRAFTLTDERPWHGRSGGGLIDVDSGYLVGVVSGYEGDRRRWTEYDGRHHGVYASHESILEFLGGLGWSAGTSPRRAPPAARPFVYGPQPVPPWQYQAPPRPVPQGPPGGGCPT